MPHRVSLSVAQKDEEATSTVEAEIPDDEWAILQSFHQYSQDLLSTKFVQDGMPSSLRIKGTSEGQLSFETRLPDWDDVVIFLHYLRPLYLQTETANFQAACNILARRLVNTQVRGMIAAQKDMYSGKVLRTAIRISVDDTVVNSEEVLSTWLNSYEYHRDPEKRRFLDTINQMLPLDASKVLFIQLLAEKVSAIAGLASFAAVLLGIKKSTDPPLHTT
jgi:hypothetical protein